MSSCQYGHDDCLNLDEKCYLCSRDGLHYKEPKKLKRGLNKSSPKITKRRGSEFEFNNNKANNELLNGVTSRQTPNSGAGQIKGDEEIVGIINIMEELKEQNNLTSRGEKTFSIHKEWLEKLHKEAYAANKEFWYLKFIFSTNDQDVYTILESDMLMSMVYTMVEDRRSKLKAENEYKILEKQLKLSKMENLGLITEIELLKAQLEQIKTDEKFIGIENRITKIRN